MEFSLSNNILPTSHHSFIPDRSPVTNLLTRLNYWSLCIDHDRPIDAIYFAVLDRVSKYRLLLKLDHLGIRGQLHGSIAI